MAKIQSIDTLRAALATGPQTVKELHTTTAISESRIRELLKLIANELDIDDSVKPMTYCLPQEEEEQEPEHTQVEGEGTTQEEPTPANGMYPCPACNGTDTALASEEEGTYLNSVLVCKDCGKAHNYLTGAEVPVPATTGGKKKRHKNLNPQKTIDKKRSAVEEAGGTLEYDGKERLWALGRKRQKTPILTFSSQELAAYSAEELVAELS